MFLWCWGRKVGAVQASLAGWSVCRCYFSVVWVSIRQISQKVYIFKMLFCIFHIFFRLWTASTHLLHTTITFWGPGRFKQNFKHFQGLENESFQIQVLYRFSSTSASRVQHNGLSPILDCNSLPNYWSGHLQELLLSFYFLEVLSFKGMVKAKNFFL